jgi:hypothetical protein
MTLQLLHSEFPYIYEENLIFFFISLYGVQVTNEHRYFIYFKIAVLANRRIRAAGTSLKERNGNFAMPLRLTLLTRGRFTQISGGWCKKKFLMMVIALQRLTFNNMKRSEKMTTTERYRG